MTLQHRMHRFVAVAGLILLFLAPWSLFGQESSETDNAKEEKKKEGLPLKAGRTIALSTNEGTWMSVDVSPDGSTIVFDLLGDLYTVPLEGGDATPITSGMAFDWQPTFSPDGKTVLFGSDRSGGNNLWTLDLESEKTRQITKGNGGLYVSPRRCCRIDRSGGAFRSGEPSPTDAVGRGPTEFGHPIQHVAREERLGLSSGFRAGSQTRSDDRLVPKDHVLHACLPRVSGGFLPPPTAEYLHASDRPIASTGPRAVPRQGVGAGPARHSIPDPLVSSAATVAQCPGEFEGAPEVQDQIPRWELACV